MFLEKVTIGSSVESAAFALVNNTYFIPTLKFGPLFYEEVNFKFLPSKKLDYCWSRLLLLLSFEGKILCTDVPNNIRVQEQVVKLNSEFGSRSFSFEKCYVFDTTNLHLENEILDFKESTFIVYDDFELSSLGGKHKWIDSFSDEMGVVKKINFYTSDRVDGANYVTDCVVESHLTKEQLHDFQYSDSMIRFFVKRYLTSKQIHGSFMNLYKNGKPKFRKPIVTHKKRIMIEKSNNKYKDSESVKFLNLSLGEIFDGIINKGA